ncbi:RIP metalloprotease [Asticcacaulis sp. AC402]|uniref:M50 family metallopeptidase n=1 Tax=Asticcacaulis sp. AC402 TaxID=1282361 RepID=UPI001F15FE81
MTFHELGHYWLARLFGTRIERFSVGFGKILLRRKDKRGTEWCISALPLGGYVKFAGDENVTSMMPSIAELEASRESITRKEGADAVKEYFHFKPLWQRFLIVLAGPVANFVLAILVFALLFATFGDRTTPATIAKLEPGGAAEAAGFLVGDTILSIDGKKVHDFADMAVLVSLRPDTPTRFVVDRQGSRVDLVATPRRVPMDDKGPNPNLTKGQLGVETERRDVFVRYNPIEALIKGNDETWKALDTNLTYVGRIFSGKENGNQIGGIVGMTKATGDITAAATQVQAPWWFTALSLLYTYLTLMAYISIAVGFLNLLPIPMLDGGHLAFYAWQGVTRKPVSPEIQNAAFRIAVVLVLGLMTFALWNDLNNTGFVKFLGGLFS